MFLPKDHKSRAQLPWKTHQQSSHKAKIIKPNQKVELEKENELQETKPKEENKLKGTKPVKENRIEGAKCEEDKLERTTKKLFDMEISK